MRIDVRRSRIGASNPYTETKKIRDVHVIALILVIQIQPCETAWWFF